MQQNIAFNSQKLIITQMLYFIPTPIGNREDITLHSLRLLKELKIFLCEDTRTTKKLLSMYEIPITDKSFHILTSFTDKSKLNSYKKLISENDVWVISEAWTPWLSDPWKSLIQLCNENSLQYSILPWANALIPAVVWAWFDTSTFSFIGFLPAKKGRQTALKTAISSPAPTFFYESVHRFKKLISDLESLDFHGHISIAREISKAFEQFWTWDFSDAIQIINSWKIPEKWEFVIGLQNTKNPLQTKNKNI